MSEFSLPFLALNSDIIYGQSLRQKKFKKPKETRLINLIKVFQNICEVFKHRFVTPPGLFQVLFQLRFAMKGRRLSAKFDMKFEAINSMRV